LKERILVVDDDGMLHGIIVRLLERLGYEAESAFSGQEAIGRVEAAHFDLICTDFQMPGMNGIELMRYVRTRSPDTAVILMTGHFRDGRVEHAGADAYLPKPFSADELLSSLALALRERHGRKPPGPA
jgi:CheY-like chemotaxis protein